MKPESVGRNGDVSLGDSLEEVLAIEGYSLVPEPEDPLLRVEGSRTVERSDPDVVVVFRNELAWSIAYHDEFLVDGVNLVGAPPLASFQYFGSAVERNEEGDMCRFVTSSGHAVWVRNERVEIVEVVDEQYLEEGR